MPPYSPDIPSIVVLDTNAILDWLVFRDPSCASWRRRFEDRQTQWVATPEMRGELAHVLGRGLDGRPLDEAALWETWALHCKERIAPDDGSLDLTRPRCTDSDDQKFIDLALACGARWLVTRDRAVLKLARRLRSTGIEVVSPRDWAIH